MRGASLSPFREEDRQDACKSSSTSLGRAFAALPFDDGTHRTTYVWGALTRHPGAVPTIRLRLLLIAFASTACAGMTTPKVPNDPQYVPGRSYFGATNYVEYIAGDAPVILTAPHGGAVNPASIPDRTDARCGGTATTTTDLNTIELVRAMQASYHARFGHYPHVVIANLSRRKLDANRTPPEATCGNAEADAAYREWHAFIDVAARAVLAAHGKGWYMDMHGHGHAIQRLELGYLLDGSALDGSDAALNTTRAFADTSSIRTIVRTSGTSLATLLRGPDALGTLFAGNGFPAVPSASDPGPKGAAYFSGGDDTRRHACGAEATALGGATDGNICGVQIETNFTGVRDNTTNRQRFGDVSALVLERFLITHWGLHLATP